VLLLADRNEPESTLAGLEWTWLKCAGIDRSTAYRGLAVLAEAQARSLEGPDDIAVYVPATARYSHTQRAQALRKF
jgi:hypothetical protein